MIKLEVRNLDKVNAFLKSLPRGTMRAAIEAFTEYMLGNERRGLRYNPPRVQHGPGNPYQWQSEKQRRAYFATNGFGGGIPYKRTGNLSAGWQARYTSGGYQSKIINTTPYAQYVQGDRQQMGHFADKWRHAYKVMADNFAGAMQAARQAVNKWLKSR
jgi:hypothetical protein